MIEKITDTISIVWGKNKGRFPYSCSILITGGSTGLIDAGCGHETLEEIESKYRPDVVVCSHIHPDHCSGASRFDPSRVWAPQESDGTVGNLEAMSRRFMVPGLRGAWRSYMRQSAEFLDFQADNRFSEGMFFDFGTTAMEAVKAPGHTDDHYCFYFPAEKLMVTTDIDFTRFGPWYGNPESDMELFMLSIERVAGYDTDIALSSHMGAVRGEIRKRFDRFLGVFEERDRKILAFLDGTARSMDDFLEAAIIYRRYPVREQILRCWEAQMIRKHLARLISRGQVLAVERGGETRYSAA